MHWEWGGAIHRMGSTRLSRLEWDICYPHGKILLNLMASLYTSCHLQATLAGEQQPVQGWSENPLVKLFESLPHKAFVHRTEMHQTHSPGWWVSGSFCVPITPRLLAPLITFILPRDQDWVGAPRGQTCLCALQSTSHYKPAVFNRTLLIFSLC